MYGTLATYLRVNDKLTLYVICLRPICIVSLSSPTSVFKNITIILSTKCKDILQNGLISPLALQIDNVIKMLHLASELLYKKKKKIVSSFSLHQLANTS